MKKFKKLSISTVVAISLLSTAAPTLTSVVQASTSNSKLTAEMDTDTEISKINNQLSAKDVDQVVNVLKKSYPDLSEDYLKTMVNNQREGDYRLPAVDQTTNHNLNGKYRVFVARSGWKGITVSQMGAAIDAAIIGASGGIGGVSVKYAIKKLGKSAAKKVIKSAIANIVGGAAGKVTATIVDKALDYAGSPGHYIAKYWDAHDKYPNNGRINF